MTEQSPISFLPNQVTPVKQLDPTNRPLAERMRPRRLEDFVGQEQLLGEGKLLWRLLQQHHIPSLLLWGPPGVGKTTLAHIHSGRGQ